MFVDMKNDYWLEFRRNDTRNVVPMELCQLLTNISYKHSAPLELKPLCQQNLSDSYLSQFASILTLTPLKAAFPVNSSISNSSVKSLMETPA